MKICIMDEYGEEIAVIKGEVPRLGEHLYLLLDENKLRCENPAFEVVEIARSYIRDKKNCFIQEKVNVWVKTNP